MAAIDTFQIVNTTQNLCNSINSIETRLMELENEIRQMHFYLDKMGIPMWGPQGRLPLANRLEELATKKDVDFLKI